MTKHEIATIEKIHSGEIAPKSIRHNIFEEGSDSLIEWVNVYYAIHVDHAPVGTQDAKKRDFTKFMSFFTQTFSSDHIDLWTPSITKQFLKHLLDQNYKATTVNRIYATLSHFAKWVEAHRTAKTHKGFRAGNPLFGVKRVTYDFPAWKAIPSRQLSRLKAACEIREKSCTQKHQNPTLEAAIFYILRSTGLRITELCNLNNSQYERGALHNILRKNKRFTPKIALHPLAREALDKHLQGRTLSPHDPLLVSARGTRLNRKTAYAALQRLSKQASFNLPEGEEFSIHPHQLRHTFLGEIAKERGVEKAQALSGNIGWKDILRYTNINQDERDDIIHALDV